MKLRNLTVPERKAVVVIGYEHNPPVISLKPLIDSFELLANNVLNIELGSRIEEKRSNLIHPVHQQLTVFAWEVLGANMAVPPPDLGKKANGAPDWKHYVLEL